MSTKTLTIQEFLEARLIEQEADGRRLDYLQTGEFLIADTAAKRAILAECQRVHQAKDREYGDGSHDLADEVSRRLAEVYRDHPDWRADW